MPLIARGTDSGDMVTSPTGTPLPPAPCPAPLDVLIVGKSPNVSVVGVGVSRLTDDVEGHSYPLADPPCAPHIPLCVAASPNVFANALPVARMDDIYDAGDGESHPVTTITQSTVFAN
jgi:uncharacterized Zn-binding protein involved in type VI secretion